MSSARVTHQALTLFFHFPTRWPILPALLGALSVHVTYPKIQNANHKHSCALTSPWCSLSTTGLKIFIISRLVGTSAESLIGDLDVLQVFLLGAAELICAGIQ